MRFSITCALLVALTTLVRASHSSKFWEKNYYGAGTFTHEEFCNLVYRMKTANGDIKIPSTTGTREEQAAVEKSELQKVRDKLQTDPPCYSQLKKMLEPKTLKKHFSSREKNKLIALRRNFDAY